MEDDNLQVTIARLERILDRLEEMERRRGAIAELVVMTRQAHMQSAFRVPRWDVPLSGATTDEILRQVENVRRRGAQLGIQFDLYDAWSASVPVEAESD
jgi:hypothetical protein